jgi:hypothetical protein
MARLALAAIVVLIIVGLVTVFVAGIFRIARTEGSNAVEIAKRGAEMQNVTFFLLVALIMYVSVTGGA